MPNVFIIIIKKNLTIIKSIIVWKWNHLFRKNYFRKKKINYCHEFMLGDFPVICFNGRRKSPVAGLNCNPWLKKFYIYNVCNQGYISWGVLKYLWKQFTDIPHRSHYIHSKGWYGNKTIVCCSIFTVDYTSWIRKGRTILKQTSKPTSKTAAIGVHYNSYSKNFGNSL